MHTLAFQSCTQLLFCPFCGHSGGQLDMTNFPPVPHSYISEDVWKELCALSRIPKFSAILDDIATEGLSLWFSGGNFMCF